MAIARHNPELIRVQSFLNGNTSDEPTTEDFVVYIRELKEVYEAKLKISKDELSDFVALKNILRKIY